MEGSSRTITIPTSHTIQPQHYTYIPIFGVADKIFTLFNQLQTKPSDHLVVQLISILQMMVVAPCDAATTPRRMAYEMYQVQQQQQREHNTALRLNPTPQNKS
jgi:hypothetical protein